MEDKIKVQWLCNKHLVSYHYWLHRLLHNVKEGKFNFGMSGYITELDVIKEYVQSHNLYLWHNEISEEMIKRKINHNSPMGINDFKVSKTIIANNRVIDVDLNLINKIANNCKDCDKLIKFNVSGLNDQVNDSVKSLVEDVEVVDLVEDVVKL